MKVQQLINVLKELDPELEAVIFTSSGVLMPVASVYEVSRQCKDGGRMYAALGFDWEQAQNKNDSVMSSVNPVYISQKKHSL